MLQGFSQDEQDFISGALSKKNTNANAPVEAVPEGPKLISLHWDPIQHSAGSIWGELKGSNKIQTLGQGEFERLAAMFSKKEAAKKAQVEEKKEKSSGGPKLRTIDSSR